MVEDHLILQTRSEGAKWLGAEQSTLQVDGQACVVCRHSDGTDAFSLSKFLKTQKQSAILRLEKLLAKAHVPQ